jgi:potassium-transporting ATPase potassium-binding subunit
MVQGFVQIAIFCALIVAVVPLLGGYMAHVFRGERTFLDPVVGPLERGTYRLLRVDPTRGQDWKAYARGVIFFSLAGWLLLFLILRTQTLHPFNPQGFHSGTWDLSFNTASSFVTNTNWQFYGGESTLSYFSQMAGLAVQNFVSAATGIAVAIALIRGIIARRSSNPVLGNFWQDLIRASFYVLLPLSIVGAIVLVSQGVVQTLGGTVHDLAVGPVASQEAIKELGTNGGGFCNVNAA